MSAVKFTSRHLELDELARHGGERERERSEPMRVGVDGGPWGAEERAFGVGEYERENWQECRDWNHRLPPGDTGMRVNRVLPQILALSLEWFTHLSHTLTQAHVTSAVSYFSSRYLFLFSSLTWVRSVCQSFQLLIWILMLVTIVDVSPLHALVVSY